MKKLFKLLIVFSSVFLFSISVNAKERYIDNYEMENEKIHELSTIASINSQLISSVIKRENTSNPTGTISEEKMNCNDLLGPNLTKIVKMCISILRIAGMIIALVNASLAVVPAITNPDKISNAKKKCISMAIVLVIIGVFPSLLTVIGNLFGYDLSCIS
ncbi:MAG: hypothetical protein PUA90_01340 [bacterium]|nr:hypothetical protein [bacterium]